MRCVPWGEANVAFTPEVVTVGMKVHVLVLHLFEHRPCRGTTQVKQGRLVRRG